MPPRIKVPSSFFQVVVLKHPGKLFTAIPSSRHWVESCVTQQLLFSPGLRNPLNSQEVIYMVHEPHDELETLHAKKWQSFRFLLLKGKVTALLTLLSKSFNKRLKTLNRNP